MPQALGDFPVSGAVSFLWNTNDQTGASITRSTDGTLKIFKANATAATWATERSSLAGVTQLEDFDATGMHSVHIDLADNTDAGFYAAGNEYQVAIVGAVVDTKTVNVVLASFSIERANGILALLKSGTFGLSAIKADTAAILVDTGTTLDAALAVVDANVDSILVDTSEIGAAGAGLTAINLPDQTMDIVGNIAGNLSGSVGSVTGPVGSVTAGVTLAASAVQAIWDALTSALTVVGSIGKLLVDNINAAMSSRMATYTQPAGFLAATFPSDPADQSLVIVATDTILARLPAALTGAGNMKADLLALDGSTTSAARLRRSASLIHDGAVTGAATPTTLIDSGLTHPDTDQLKGRILIFDGNVTAGLREQATDIISFNPTTDTLTFTALTQAPASGDTFVIV